MRNESHQAIAEEAFHKLEDESLHCKIYGHKQRAIEIILAAIDRARDEWLEADYVASNDPAAQPQGSDVDCMTVGWSSRVCNRGTKGCDVTHEPPATDDRVKEQEWTVEYQPGYSILNRHDGTVPISFPLAFDTSLKQIARAHNAALNDVVSAAQMAAKLHEQQLLQAQAAIAGDNAKLGGVIQAVAKDTLDALAKMNK